MKKLILFLFLVPFLMLAQNPTNFPYGIKNPVAPTNTTPTYLTTTSTTGLQEKIPSAYIEKTANKTSTISGYSETLYPNEKSTHDALDLKLNISDLPTNLTLYPTTTASDVSGYVVMVKDIHDVRYNTTAVDVSTPTITTTDQLVSQRISDAGVLIGQPGVFNITTFGNIRHLNGSGSATFYFKVFHRDSAGVETLICTSSISSPVTDGGYSEFTASGVWDDGDFVASDRIVIKSYANRIAGGSDPVYQFQFGGTSPVRTLLPVPFSVVDAGYELSANKQNSLAIDGTGTKYPTVDAVNAGLPVNYSKIVYVNATSPITATIFDTENPPVTNDNLLKNDVANLYIGTDASTWVYNSSTYVTKSVTATSSNFYLAGTTTDAGNTKTGHITRSGAVTLTGSLNMAIAKISITPNTSAGSYDILTRNSSTTALEKKSVSDFIQTTGSQSKTGKLTMSSTDVITGGFVNINGATTGSFSSNSNNSTGFFNQNNNNSTSDFNVDRNTSTGRFARQINESSGSFFSQSNQSTGFFLNRENTSSGVFSTNSNQSAGVFEKINSTTGSTGDLIQYLKNNVVTTSINHLGEINTVTPTASTQVATKGYTDAKITQTITNGVTDKSPSEDAVYDAIDGVVKTIISDIPTSTNTGGVSEVLMHTYTIAGGKLPASCMPNLKIRIAKTGTAGTVTVKVRVNTVNDFATATNIGFFTSATSMLGSVFVRNFTLQGGQLTHTNAANSSINDESANANVNGVISYDPSVTQYWFISLQNSNAGDTTRVNSIKMVN